MNIQEMKKKLESNKILTLREKEFINGVEVYLKHSDLTLLSGEINSILDSRIKNFEIIEVKEYAKDSIYKIAIKKGIILKIITYKTAY